MQSGTVKKPVASNSWKELVAQYQTPSFARSLWQIANTLVPYAILWYLMYRSLQVSYWITLPLALLAGAFLVRIFIIFHDCTHGSFFRSRRANDLVGFITGVLAFTPYRHWRWEHSVHHATSGDLDSRGRGDVWTLTVEEYLQSSKWKRFSYRLARNPIILLVIAPLVLFVGMNRIPSPKASRRDQMSVYWTNLALAGMFAAGCWAMGSTAYLVLQFVVMLVAGSAGIWLFYVQHQFEGVYWEREQNWDYVEAALKGSSFYRLPRILQWFSGNIGFHHIHHLSARIPNYNLEKCHKANPLFQQANQVTLLSSLKSLSYRLWDERNRRLVGYGYLRQVRQQARSS
jgi:omega-6 fatty acid desaturase (delta-12 desaturase)